MYKGQLLALFFTSAFVPSAFNFSNGVLGILQLRFKR